MEQDINREKVKISALFASVRSFVLAVNKERGVMPDESGWLSFAVGNVIFGYSVADGVQANISSFGGDNGFDYEVKIDNLGNPIVKRLQKGDNPEIELALSYPNAADDLDNSTSQEIDPASSEPSAADILEYIEKLIIGNNQSN